MDEPSTQQETGHDTREAGRGAEAGMPRWVKVSGIVVVILVLLVVVLALTGALGEHGPGMHGL
jgi:hypothetical protein